MRHCLLPLFVLLTSCLPTIAPPAHYAAMGPAAAVVEPEVEVAASCCFLPALGVVYDASLGERGLLVGEVQGQLGPTHGAVTPALVIRSRDGRTRYGVRFGGTAGMGDIYALPYKMPWAGGGMHFLLTSQLSADRPTRFTLAVGGEASMPLFGDNTAWTVVDDNGDQIGILPFPNAFGSLDLRLDIPVRESGWFFVGGGVDVSIYGVPIPAITLGGRG